MNTMVVIPFLCLLAMICSSMAENYCKQPEETIWLGENITLATKKIPDISRPVIWESGDLKYECDSTCAETSYYKVAETDGVSTIWIKEVSWRYAKWKFNDDNFHFGTIDMKINAKPKNGITNTTDCEYTVMAECSLPKTSIECFVGNNTMTLTSSTTDLCADGKTYNTTATLKLLKISGTLICHFTMEKLFNETLTTDVDCPVSGTTTGYFTEDATKSGNGNGDNSNQLILTVTLATVIPSIVVLIGVTVSIYCWCKKWRKPV